MSDLGQTRDWKQRCEIAEANLAATEEALLDATDRLEQAKTLCREQVMTWRAQKEHQQWIENQPTTIAYYGPLLGN